MVPDRRTFLRGVSAATVAAGLPAHAAAQDAPAVAQGNPPVGVSRTGRALKLLVLGGTRFLGPAVVEAALARGHTVTLFNRGRSNPHLFPDLEKLVGDRDPDVGAGLAALEGRAWDAVVDTCAFVPRVAEASARLLSGRVGHYALVSTVSVYSDLGPLGLDEDAPVGTLDDPSVEEVTNTTYGPLKALCEDAVEAGFEGRTTIARPGLIVGPRDRTHRFAYWPLRVRAGGEVLAPGDGRDPVQWIDVRDLAGFLVTSVEDEVTGRFNVVGPRVEASMAELVHGCKAVTAGDARFTWVDAKFLEERSILPWGQMPVWYPRDGESAGIGAVSNARALEAGLGFTPLADTVRDTLAWIDGLAPEDDARALQALAPDREAEVLAAWRQENG